MNPEHPTRQMFARAAQAHQAGQLAQAETLYRRILADYPQHGGALHMLGVLQGQQGNHDEAETLLRRAAELQPNNSAIHNNLGEARRRRGALDEAIASYQHALHLSPDFAEAHYNLANVLKVQQRPSQAITHYREATRLKPDYASAHYNLANTLLEYGDCAGASASYRQALLLRPDHAEAHNNLGAALKECGKEDEAIVSYRKAAELKPDFAEALRNEASLLEQQGYIDEAREVFGRYLRLEPDDDMQRLRLETICPLIAESNQQIDDYRAHLARTIERYAAQPPRIDLPRLHLLGVHPPFMLIYQGRDDRPLREQWAALFAGRLPTYERPISRAGKPHIGFVVTRGHEGVFLKDVGGLLNHLSGEQFRLTVVCSQQGSAQILRSGIRNPAVAYLPLPARLDHAAARMHEAAFDVLYHWHVGSDATNYFLPFFALAPVQCAFWGMMFTTGIPTVHYLTSAEGLETDESDQHYSETLVRFTRLPTHYMRPPVPDAPRPRSSFGFSERQHLYVCPQNLRKVHPDCDPLLADLLRRDPDGLVVLIEDRHPHLADLLRRRFQQNMPDVAERVRFVARMPRADYLALLARADVLLDTLHFGGGVNTTSDAFAAGTPLITLPTAHQRGRYAAAAYRQMGLDDGIAATPAEFVELALRYGTDRAENQRLRAAIHAASPALFEDMQPVHELADFFEQIVAQARRQQ